jgi:hypothetical protein
MEYREYLREQAAKHRPLAEKTVDPTIKPELLELTAVCEEVGDRIDDHAIQNEPHDADLGGLDLGHRRLRCSKHSRVFKLSAARPDDDPALAQHRPGRNSWQAKLRRSPMRAREGCSNVSVNFFFEGRDTIDRVVQNWGESPLSLLTQPLAFRLFDTPRRRNAAFDR